MEKNENVINTLSENIMTDENINNTVENTVIADDNTTLNDDKLDLIHQDLGFIICFIVFFVLVILLKYAYKFFDMVFQF